ncbi:MAG: exopolysaccharide biosynthesis polyprenyl glycosylphosphotransferase [Lachnospiraceae bacterium]|nr:exopolysaccharide biosynthesis polyprenyl glycosylphosphotransferase [Lachnospiraceae bacterium]
MFLLYYGLAYTVLFLNDIWHMMRFDVSDTAIYLLCLCYCLFFFVLLFCFESFRIGERRILDLIFGFFLGSVCLNFVVGCFAVIFTSLFMKRVVFLFVLSVILESLIGLLWILFCYRIYEKFQFCREAVFIYGNRENETEFTRINNTINLFFKISRSMEYSVGMEAITNAVQTSSIVFLGDIPVDVRNSLIKFCMGRGIECYSVPKISDIYIQNASVMQLHDKLLLRYPKLEITGMSAAAKRLTDIAVSLFMLVLLSPAMAVIAIAIKLDDGGPVIYSQERVTRGGKPFRMYKFRSMQTDAEKDGIQLTTKLDVRVTRVGKVIRNIHFDELPQLVNILKGEMSLVGPRPERMEFIQAYTERIPEFSERLRVRGGLTGYAQIYGRYNSEPEDKIKYDLYYIYNYSYGMDIKILILTIRILFQKENTEGMDDNYWINSDIHSMIRETEHDKGRRRDREGHGIRKK